MNGRIAIIRQELGGTEGEVDRVGRACVQQRAARQLVEQRRDGAKERHHRQQLEHQRPAPGADPRRLIGSPSLGFGAAMKRPPTMADALDSISSSTVMPKLVGSPVLSRSSARKPGV